VEWGHGFRKELKADFGLGGFVLRDFWATKAALGVTMLSYNLLRVFCHAVMRQKVHHTLSTLHHQVLAVGRCKMRTRTIPSSQADVSSGGGPQTTSVV